MASRAKTGSSLLEFSLKLYKEILDGDKNAFISPFSVSSALLLAELGANGETGLEIRKALGLDNLSQKDVPRTFKAIQDGVNEQTQGSTTLETANRVFAAQGLKVNSEYTKDSARYYGSGLELMDFRTDPEGSREKINKWVEKRTREKITDLLPRGVIDTCTLMVLVNAIYFKGKWLQPFEEGSTVDMPFHVAKGRTKLIKMMRDERRVRFIQDEQSKFTAVELPYEDGTVSMVFIRPEEIGGLRQLEKDLTASKFESLLNSLSRSYKPEVNLGIPRFKMETVYSMKENLKNLGITAMFQAWNGGFIKMLPDSPDAYFSEAIHKAFIEVKEEGTEAAAATALVMVSSRCARERERPKRFFLDRPFMFVLWEARSGTVLFMGRCTHPEFN